MSQQRLEIGELVSLEVEVALGGLRSVAALSIISVALGGLRSVAALPIISVALGGLRSVAALPFCGRVWPGGL